MWISTLPARCIPCRSFKIFNIYRYRYQSKVYKLVHPLFKLMCVTGHVCRRACRAPFFTIPHLCYLFIFNDYSASFPVTELNRLRRQLFCATFSSAVLITLPHYSSPSTVPYRIPLEIWKQFRIITYSLSLPLFLCVCPCPVRLCGLANQFAIDASSAFLNALRNQAALPSVATSSPQVAELQMESW